MAFGRLLSPVHVEASQAENPRSREAEVPKFQVPRRCQPVPLQYLAFGQAPDGSTTSLEVAICSARRRAEQKRRIHEKVTHAEKCHGSTVVPSPFLHWALLLKILEIKRKLILASSWPSM